MTIARFQYHLIVILLCLSFIGIHSKVEASHKCPKPPDPPISLFGIFLTTTYLPVASAMASTRSFNTSGCERGHPSDSFYKPRGWAILLYLEGNRDNIEEESAQGQGRHLDALGQLIGCSSETIPLFAKTLKQHYHSLFDFPSEDDGVLLGDKISKLIYKNTTLNQSCNQPKA